MQPSSSSYSGPISPSLSTSKFITCWRYSNICCCYPSYLPSPRPTTPDTSTSASPNSPCCLLLIALHFSFVIYKTCSFVWTGIRHHLIHSFYSKLLSTAPQIPVRFINQFFLQSGFKFIYIVLCSTLCVCYS